MIQATLRPVVGWGQVPFPGIAKPVTPFGGLVNRIEFLSKVGLAKNVKKAMPFKLSSPKVIPLPHRQPRPAHPGKYPSAGRANS